MDTMILMAQSFLCDPQCPNVTHTHMSRPAVAECRARRSRGEIQRARALTPHPERAFDIVTTVGDDYSGTDVVENLSSASKWRPNFRDASLHLSAPAIEGAYLPGADFRGVHCDEFVPGVPLYMMTESRGAIIDDAVVDDALVGDRAWLMDGSADEPTTSHTRLALDFVVPFIQWSFSDDQWESLLHNGCDPDELVQAAQEFPPLNRAGFIEFLNSGDAAMATALHPHAQSWGGRELTLPPRSNIRSRQMRAARSA